MGENYAVNYDINVQSQAALQALNSFQQATNKLSQAGKQLTAFQKKIESVTSKLNQMSRKAPVLDIATSKVNKKLDAVIVKMEKIHALARKTASLNISSTGAATHTTKSTSSPKISKVSGGRSPAMVATTQSTIPRNISYRALGPAMLDSGGIGAFDLVKGMGIAYGISGLGSLMGSTISAAVDYDNIMMTARNILGTHDKDKETFASRFNQMERIVRDVGVKTKFTAPQVADASKFLSMAGFDIEAINQSIRPIADIALVGDTDLGETADVVTNIMTGYGISPSQVRKAADIMTMTFTKSNTTLMEIAEAYKYSASLLSAGGVSFEESTAAMGILGDAGIKGSQAGTTLRTIMANIVNPTKKQFGNWERIGVSRTDKNGRVRPLSEIFQDLKNADLYVDDFYKLFHKTAAQGAVSLASNVDKWNEIIELNFMSDSTVNKLAKEKQNTIQGLWYQMSSAFTETGMQVFEEMNSPIRDFLQDTIVWLKTDEAKKAMKEMGGTILVLLKFLKEFAFDLINLYNRFGGFIKLWLMWQVRLSAILIPLRIFKSLINFSGFIVNGAKQIGQLAMQFGILSKNIKATVSAQNGFRGAVANILPLNMIAKSRGYSPEVVARYNQMNHSRIGGLMTGIAGGASILGAMGGAYLGSMVGDQGSALSMVGTIGGGLIGGAAFAKLATFFPAILSMIATPIGIGALIVAGVGTAAYHFYKYQEAIQDATEANNQFLSSTASLNGINYSEHATMADKYLSIVYNRQLDTNRAIGEHINLMREQLGLMKEASSEVENHKKFSETHKDIFDHASKAWGAFATDDAKQNAAISNIYLPNGNIDYQMMVSAMQNLNSAGAGFTTYRYNGVDFGSGNNHSYSQIAASRLLYGLGRDTSEGTKLRTAIDGYRKRILFADNQNDFFAVIKDLNDYSKQLTYTPGSDKWSLNTVGSNANEQNQQGYHYVTAYKSALASQFMWNDPKTALASMLQTWQDILGKHSTGKPIEDNVLSKFLLQGGIDIFNSSRYGSFGSDSFMKQFGWFDNQWNSGTYQYFNKEKGKLETVTLTSDEARRHFLTFHQQIIDLTNQLSPKIRPYFESFINSPVWGYGDPNASTVKEGSTVEMGGSTWTYSNGMWKANSGPFKPLSNQEMQNKLKADAGATGAGSTASVGGATGASQANYKSHYNNNSAAPKQVIVKIENLMNVESVDLSNPDNAAVIADLKGQLTQALVDVVHDFDETYHG